MLKKIGSFFKKNDKIIQGICSLLSVILIGGFSMYISSVQTNLNLKQTQIAYNEKRAIINVLLQYPSDEDGLAKLIIHNNGAALLNQNIIAISFFDIRCDEYYQGSTFYPIRVFVYDASQMANASDFDYQENELGAIYAYTDKTPKIGQIEKEVLEVSKNGWAAMFCTLIRIETENMLNETEYTYYLLEGQVEYSMENYDTELEIGFLNGSIVDRPIISRVDSKLGETIYNEYYQVQTTQTGWSIPTNPHFSIASLDGVTVFKYALQKARELNLYAADPYTNEIKYYGDYEPSFSKYWEQDYTDFKSNI